MNTYYYAVQDGVKDYGYRSTLAYSSRCCGLFGKAVDKTTYLICTKNVTSAFYSGLSDANPACPFTLYSTLDAAMQAAQKKLQNQAEESSPASVSVVVKCTYFGDLKEVDTGKPSSITNKLEANMGFKDWYPVTYTSKDKLVRITSETNAKPNEKSMLLTA